MTGSRALLSSVSGLSGSAELQPDNTLGAALREEGQVWSSCGPRTREQHLANVPASGPKLWRS